MGQKAFKNQFIETIFYLLVQYIARTYHMVTQNNRFLKNRREISSDQMIQQMMLVLFRAKICEFRCNKKFLHKIAAKFY